MTQSHLRHALAAALTGVVLAAIPEAGLARVDSTVSAVAPSSEASPAAASHREPSTRSGAPVTLYVEDPNGNAFRLVHVDGKGWRYAIDGPSRGGRFASLLRKVTFRTDPEPAATSAASEALTVFIDGPSGYTFVWTADGTWKFVGTLSARRP